MGVSSAFVRSRKQIAIKVKESLRDKNLDRAILRDCTNLVGTTNLLTINSPLKYCKGAWVGGQNG
jgi:hypothetical protein